MNKKKFTTILVLCFLAGTSLILFRAYQNNWAVNLIDPVILLGMASIIIITIISFLMYRKTLTSDSNNEPIKNKILVYIFVLVFIANLVYMFSTFRKPFNSSKSEDEIIRNLFQAETNKDSKKVMELIKKQPNLINASDELGRTLLHSAANRGNLERIKYLIANNAFIDAQDHDGLTPLYWAVGTGNLTIVECLIDHGANVNHRAKVKFYKVTPIFSAVSLGHKEIVKLLIAKGADVNIKDSQSRTPLMWALTKGQNEIANLIRQNGGIE